FRDVRIVAKGAQHLLLALELLQEVGLQVGAAGNFHYLEQRQQRDVMILRARLADEMARAPEQVLESQESPDTFVERVLVGDHDRAVINPDSHRGKAEIR